jgi:mannitol/fructose-specific phosphotransferase system IIA component (Ntr-type)
MNIEKAVARVQRYSENRYKALLGEQITEEAEDSIFESRLCFLNSKFQDFREVILHYGGLLEDIGYAKEGFCGNILEREKKGSTYIGKGISIPHALDNYVNKSKICIIRLETPIVWLGNELEFIIILCLKFNDIPTTKKVFKNLYSILGNNETISKMKELQSPQDMINVFIKGGFSYEQHN